MKIDALACRTHYFDHLAPLWRRLDPSERGRFFVPWEMKDYAEQRGIEVQVGSQRGTGLLLVCSVTDMRAGRGRPLVFAEHGAGQSYLVPNGAYSGGPGRGSVVLFLCPSEAVAARNRETYPGVPSVVIGCPKLADLPDLEGNEVAISFHFSGNLVPEMRSAFNHYRFELPKLARNVNLIGHAHPRVFDRFARIYEAAGVEPVRDFTEVCRRAGLYVADNSSTIFEFAALGRPVVLLNAPWYRRHIEQGLRFWDCADVGLQVNTPEELLPGIEAAREDPLWRIAQRADVSRRVFAHLDGDPARLGVEAIRALG